MWHLQQTSDTRIDEPDEAEQDVTLVRLWARLLVLAAVTAADVVYQDGSPTRGPC